MRSEGQKSKQNSLNINEQLHKNLVKMSKHKVYKLSSNKEEKKFLT